MRYKILLLVALLLLFTCGCSNKTWPLNENTNGVVEPPFIHVDYVMNEFGVTNATYHGVTEEDSKSYITSLQNRHFVKDVKENEFLNFYYFTAINNKTNIKIKYFRLPTGSVIITLDKK